MFRPVFALAVLLAIMQSHSLAAQFTQYSNPALNCVARMDGEIVSGDLERLQALLAGLRRDKKLGDTIPHDPDVAVDSTNNAYNVRLCLNSQGGNLAEAIRMGDAILTVIGTAVQADDDCLSACAVLFMAGSYSSESDAGVVPSRLLDVRGRLGFHAPDLAVAAGQYDEGTVQQAFGVAIQSLGQIMERTGRFKFAYTLVSELLKTPPREFFYINTVGRAARWEIEVYGAVVPSVISPLSVSNACNNRYQQHLDRLQQDQGTAEGEQWLRSGWIEPFEPRTGSFSLQLEGFAQEGATVCGFDASLTAEGKLEGYVYLGSDSGARLTGDLLFDRDTELASLARDRFTARPTVSSLTPPLVQTRSGHCVVESSGRIADFHPCQSVSETATFPSLATEKITSFVWPSGAKTIVVESLGTAIGQNTYQYAINGEKTAFTTAPDAVNQACAAKLQLEGNLCANTTECFPNARTGNLFCFIAER